MEGTGLGTAEEEQQTGKRSISLLANLSFGHYGEIMETVRCQLSTIDVIKVVVDFAMSVKNVPARSERFCALVTLNLKNAFNSAKWIKMMKALERKKIPKYLLNVMDSCLINRTLLYETENGIEIYSMTAGALPLLTTANNCWDHIIAGNCTK